MASLILSDDLFRALHKHGIVFGGQTYTRLTIIMKMEDVARIEIVGEGIADEGPMGVNLQKLFDVLNNHPVDKRDVLVKTPSSAQDALECPQKGEDRPEASESVLRWSRG